MTPTVSVIVPNYNHAPFLKERIDSILNQNYQDFEVIILDDCSSDNSKDIIENYKSSPKISHIVYNAKNSGSTFKQWKKGINLAKGEIIWIAESDDVADDEFLSTLVPLMRSEFADIIFCGSRLIDTFSNPIPMDLDISLRRSLYPKENFHKFEAEYFLNNFMIFENFMYNASAILFKKHLWNDIEHDFIDFKSSGDWLCWIRMLLKSKFIIWHNSKLNRFRIHLNKVSPKAIKSGLILLERKRIVDILLSFEIFGKMVKQVVIGRSYYMIFKANINKDIRNKLMNIWKDTYPFPMLRIMFFFIYSLKKKFLIFIFQISNKKIYPKM